MISRIAIALAAITCCAAPVAAGPILPDYDFSSPSPGNITNLGASATLAGNIQASAWYLDGSTWTASVLTARGEAGDHGLGVCSELTPACNFGGTGSGDVNELSQLEHNEAILLERPDNTTWAGLWLSSLDNNDGVISLGPENGILYWGSSSDIATLLGGSGNSLTFSYPEFTGGAVEGKLPLGGLDTAAKYLLFLPGGSVGSNNDYLVWGADLAAPKGGGDNPPVPEPASLVLLGTGLAALGYKRRRRGI